MAMTKAERAKMDDLERRLREAMAFRFTDPVEPDVEIPEEHGELRKGWLFNECAATVACVCTSPIAHGYGGDDDTHLHGARRLYSTRLRALRALRNALERKYAKLLADIDRHIEKEVGA